jgi:ABC-type ATPase with predicted acetyltransferase domain
LDVQVSRFSYAFLNRQFIVLLNELGVRDQVFADLFKDAVREVQGMAARIAKGVHHPADVRRGDKLTTYPVRAMVKYGFRRDACL